MSSMTDTTAVRDWTDADSRDMHEKLTIFETPPLEPPPSPAQLADTDLSAEFERFDCSALLRSHPESEVREAITELVRAIAPGVTVTPLFAQRVKGGMSLLHVWFGPHFPLWRHSHPGLGDCLYYVISGQAIMGSRVLGAGDGLFVPNGLPYKYRAGPEGVEVLEFRPGGGTEGAPAIKIEETSLDEIYRQTAVAKEHHHEWVAPTTIASSPLTAHLGALVAMHEGSVGRLSGVR
jgi:hypothetical protein